MSFRRKLQKSADGDGSERIWDAMDEWQQFLPSEHPAEQPGSSESLAAQSGPSQPGGSPRQPDQEETYYRSQSRPNPKSLAAALEGPPEPLEPPSKAEQLWSRIATLAIVLASCGLVFWQLHPDLIFTRNTPTGGDMGAHVWGPAYLKENLFSWWRHSGWTPDWYAGFPAFHFYMVVPYFFIIVLDLIVPDFVISYGVSFKLVAVAGAVLLPAAAWFLAKKAGFRFPIPPLFAVATLPFLFNDLDHTRIWGGTLPSLLAGEFAYSLSLLLALFALGIAVHGIRHGGYRVAGAITLALVGLCHIVPAFFALVSLAVLVVVYDNRRAAVQWLAVVLPLAGLLGAFWALPFWWRRDYFNDMGWEDNTDYLAVLLLSDSYSYWRWILVAAGAGAAVTMIYRIRFGWFLLINVAVWAAAYRYGPIDRLLNGRLVPFYHLSLGLLAALGVGVLLWRLFGGDVRGFVEGRRAGGGDGYGYRIKALQPGMSSEAVPGAQLRSNSALLLSRWLSVTNVVFVALGLVLLALVIDGYFFNNWLTIRSLEEFMGLSGDEMLADPDGSDIVIEGDASKLAPTLAGLFRLLGLGVLLVGLAEAVNWAVGQAQARSKPKVLPYPNWLTIGAVVVTLAFLVGLAIPLRALGVFGVTKDVKVEVEENGETTTQIKEGYALDIPFFPDIGTHTGPFNLASGWARHNFTGYEGLAGYPEYQAFVNVMADVGEQYGCGRALWEYDNVVLNAYGTTMAPMLLPHWTDGCIGSMEGLYFESSASVAYHFLMQSELSSPHERSSDVIVSSGPSRAMRDLPYRNFNIDQGVEHMQLMGVRYYLTNNTLSTTAARQHPDLIEITNDLETDWSTIWSVFEVLDSELVQPLRYEPVVMDDVSNGQSSWLEPAVKFFNEHDFSVFPAASGPEHWERVSVAPALEDESSDASILDAAPTVKTERISDLLPKKELPPVRVRDIVADGDGIFFTVDEPGVPVLVKASYFPNWKVEGAEGPWRVAPNLMVVIPTGENVKLSYGWTKVEAVAYALTGFGWLVALLLLVSPGWIPWGHTGKPRRKLRDRFEWLRGPFDAVREFAKPAEVP